jgi:ketosteroid isomerase-like protein
MSRDVPNSKLILERLFAAGDAGETDSFKAYLHDDVVVHAPMGLSTSGIAAEQESWRKATNAIADLRHEFVAVLQDGGLEAARCVVTGTLDGVYGGLSAVAKSFTVDQALFARIRDGKIEELWEIVDSASLLSQLGGAKEPSPSR